MRECAQRTRFSCDGCAFRRVKCSGGQPCVECSIRSVNCTLMRRRRKRGPKGPRSSTAEKLNHHKESLVREITSNLAVPELASSLGEWSYKENPSGYHAHLETFRNQLYTVWPIVDVWKLLDRLDADLYDWQPHALAASLCAAVIAQLRLDRHSESGAASQASGYAEEAQVLRNSNDFREYVSLDSLLASFFLHIYYSNVQRLPTAAYLLRDAITTAHLLRLHEPETYETLPTQDYQRRLRIYWVLFVTERTFCAQNDLAPILDPISELPTLDSQESSPGFADLARLFICLEASFFRCDPPSRIAAGSREDRVKILCIQKQLEQDVSFPGISETQHVDLNITRHWIRAIIWRYTITHFTQSGQSKAPAFSAMYPAQIAKDSLSLLANASSTAIRAHGYGMASSGGTIQHSGANVAQELKILLLANSMLDVFACMPDLKFSVAAQDWRHALFTLGDILHTVGGGDSHFAALLKRRMMEAGLVCAITRQPALTNQPHMRSGYTIQELPEDMDAYDLDGLQQASQS